MEHLSLTMTRLCLALLEPRRRDERGDVPGWVLITVMTAGLVMVIWQVAEEQLSSMLTSALNKVR
jgi:hypothetical protein